MKQVNSFNIKHCCLSQYFKQQDFRKKITMLHLESVNLNFQIVQIAFTHVIQCMLLQSREVGGEKEIILPILLRAGYSA